MDTKKKRFSLSFKQVLIIVIPLAIVALYTMFSTLLILGIIMKRNVAEKVEFVNEKVQYETQQTFTPPSVGLSALGESLRVSSSPESIMLLLNVYAAHYPQCLEFFFASAGSNAFLTNNSWVPPKDFNYKAADWYTGARAMKGSIFATLADNAHGDKEQSIVFTKAAYDSKNNFIGVVGTEILFSKFSDILESVTISPNSKLCLVTDPKDFISQNTVSFKSMNTEELFDGKPKAFIQGDYFYGVQKLAGTEAFVLAFGPMKDFTAKSQMWINIIICVTLCLIFGCVAFNASITSKTNKKEQEVSDRLISETQNLTVSSKETAATAQDQSAAVKEIVTTMEDNTALSEDISQKIKDVSGVAAKTNNDVTEGVNFIAENVRQLQEIADTNTNTINGIKALGDKIENIWDIVSLINSVADQAKIIAFNAELEASSAGEAGKNFHIVATEIRRLADGIIDGTKEIKGKITEIQESSDALILASENGTEKIQSGVDNAKNLEERFSSIKDASEITAESAEKITTIIQQQAVASEQILVTLKQIASGVENFTAATEHISKSSQNLKTLAIELSASNKKEKTDNA